MTGRPVRLALVGIGKIARDQHVPAITSNGRFELVATASRNAGLDGVTAYRSIEALLEGEKMIDAVSIATPPVGRHLIAAKAIQAGLHVMIEKPPGATLSEVASLDADAAAAGVTLFASWHSREAASVDAARAWLSGRSINKVTILWREDIRRWHPGQDWILGPGGFGVFDPGINALSIVTAILPNPLNVIAATIAIPDGRDSPIDAMLIMRSGTTEILAEFDFLKQGHQQWDILVETDRGTLALRDGGRTLDVDGATVEGQDEEYPRLYRRFADLIAQRKSDVDVTPLRLVADAYLLAERRSAVAFTW